MRNSNGNVMKSHDSQILVKEIRADQGLGVMWLPSEVWRTVRSFMDTPFWVWCRWRSMQFYNKAKKILSVCNCSQVSTQSCVSTKFCPVTNSELFWIQLKTIQLPYSISFLICIKFFFFKMEICALTWFYLNFSVCEVLLSELYCR